MNNENNKMQVDIENLFKQNVNDLSAIKELYRKLKEVEEKITQIKYIDSNLANKLKKEYEKLKKRILDENAQAELTNDIEKLNIKLTNDIETINTKLTNIIARELANVNQNLQKQIDNRISKNENNTISSNMLTTELLEQINGGSINVNVNTSMIEDYSVISSKLEMCNLDVKCTHFGDFPNYDSKTKTLTFNSGCRVYWGNIGAYEIPSDTTVINSVAGQWIKLVFNTDENSLRFVDDWVEVGTKEIVILSMSKSLKNTYGMDITIDGSYKKPIRKPTETEKQ